MKNMDKNKLAGLIDHTLLRPDATEGDILNLCLEAKKYGFHCVCVNPGYIQTAVSALKGSGIGVCTVIGFPLGATLRDVKIYEAQSASLLGATEIDSVINIGAAKSGGWETVYKDISDVIAATRGLVHKVIIETCYLERAEKVRVVETALKAGADFIKTSTGFGSGGATVEDIRLIRDIVGKSAGVKAAGGIRTLSVMMRMLEAGADRIGTSSGPSIMDELERGQSN